MVRIELDFDFGPASVSHPIRRQHAGSHAASTVQKDGPTQAIEALTDRIRAPRNPSAIVRRSGLTPEANAVYLERRQANYIQWAETTEGQLGNVTHDPAVLAFPYTPAYYDFRARRPRIGTRPLARGEAEALACRISDPVLVPSGSKPGGGEALA